MNNSTTAGSVSLSKGQIIGIAVGVPVGVIALVGGLVAFIVIRKKRSAT